MHGLSKIKTPGAAMAILCAWEGEDANVTSYSIKTSLSGIRRGVVPVEWNKGRIIPLICVLME